MSSAVQPYGRDLRDAGRLVATATAVFSLGAAVIHLSAASDHRNLPVMMAGFIVVATLQAGLGALLLARRPSRLLCLAAVALMAGSVGVWLLSRTAGLPFLPGGHMEPIGFKDGITVLFELATLPGLLLLLSREIDAVALPTAALGNQVVGLAGAAAFALMVPAFMLDGGGHHAAGEMAAAHGHGAGEAEMAGGGHGHGAGAGHAEQAHGHGSAQHAGSQDHHGAEGEGMHGLAHASSGHGTQMAGHPHSGAAGPGEVAHRDAGGGHGHGGSQVQQRSASGGHGHGGGSSGGDSGHGGAEHGAGGHGGGEAGHADGGHGDGGHGNEGGGEGGGGQPGRLMAGYEPADPGGNGRRPQGSQIFLSGGAPDDGGATHVHGGDGPCNPTPEQRAAADRLYRVTDAALRKYDNNPARAIADGYHLAWRGGGTPDRFLHMFAEQHVYDTTGGGPPRPGEGNKYEPVVMDPNRIESFMYAMTDRGLTAIGGMYLMPAGYNEAKGDLLVPREPFAGPQVGGCITRWHDHPELGRMTNRSGAPTPQMLHVWTYPGLEPYGEYTPREFAAILWKPGSLIPNLEAPVQRILMNALFGGDGPSGR